MIYILKTMKTNLRNIFFLLLTGIFACNAPVKKAPAEPEGFVPVKGLQFLRGNTTINIGDFEILDHPVTNLEYKAFIDATDYPPPLHWKNGSIPAGKEEYPVIFVNRDDVTTYTDWLTQATGRVYRMPTPFEFELAAYGGEIKGTRYYWGDSKDMLTPENINFNHTGDRKYNEWEKHLKPARWGMQNSIGLYQMAGNVWQLLTEFQDPAMSTYKYRIEKLQDMDRRIRGGGWVNTIDFVGESGASSPGRRVPDIGIRLVREPEGESWSTENRRIAAFTHSPGKISLSWALLDTDTRNTRFNIYRLEGNWRSHKGVKLNTEPLTYTSYLDENAVTEGVRYQYRVITVDENGKELKPSDWAAITAGENLYPVIVKFKPILQDGRMAPVFGDIEGYGKPGCVIRLDNGNRESSQDPGHPVQLEAFSYTGRSLWRKDIAYHSNIFGSSSNCPFNVWDMDGDGKAEVITLLQVGEENYLAILDGMSGKVLHKTPWDKMATDFSRSSTRIQMSIAYLDGKTPSVITQTGLYENEVVSAYDNTLNKLWTFESFRETSGSGSHHIEVADVDNDGKHDIFLGTTCLNNDGTVRWSIYREHADKVYVNDIIPDRPGLEVFYIVETPTHAGVYMVDANTGEEIWKSNRADDPLWRHGHSGWLAEIWEGSPGMEGVSNRAGHGDRNYVLFSADGKRIMENFPFGYPVEWDGDHTRELITQNGKMIGKFNGTELVPIPGEIPNPVPNSSLIFAGDIYGDFRSELVISATDTDGRPAVMVVAAPNPIEKKYLTPTQDRDYMLWLGRNIGGGYGNVRHYDLRDPEK